MTALRAEYIIPSARRLDIPPYLMAAVAAKEARGRFARAGGKIPALYERHWAYRHIRDNYGIDVAEDLSRKHPDIINRSPGGYGRYDEQYGKVARMIRLGYRETAHYCTSWGAFQIMGFHHDLCGFPTAQAMADFMHQSPVAYNQILVFERFISKYQGGKALNALRNMDIHEFARRYNGKNYRQNNYARDLFRLIDKYAAIKAFQ